MTALDLVYAHVLELYRLAVEAAAPGRVYPARDSMMRTAAIHS